MYGGSFGDIAGSSYEFSKKPEKGFILLDPLRKSTFTDDTVLSAAIGKALLMTEDLTNETELRFNVRRFLQQFCNRFPFSGYGDAFAAWVERFDYEPYGSCGSGAASRIGPVAWIGDTAEQVLRLSDICTGVTHNHPEGIKGARAIALAVFLARYRDNNGQKLDKKYIRKCIQQRFYMLDFSIDEIRDTYEYSDTCQGTVPQAIEAFLESDSFESAIYHAISIGGDSDTIGCMTGAIAEAYYGVPDEIKKVVRSYVDAELISVFDTFEEKYHRPLL